MLKRLNPQNDSEVKINEDLFSTLISKLDIEKEIQEELLKYTFDNVHKNPQKAINKRLTIRNSNGYLLILEVKLLCKSCDNFQLKTEEYLHICVCGNQAYISTAITNFGAPAKVDINLSIENIRESKFTNMFNFGKKLKRDEIIQNDWQFLPSSKRGSELQLETSRYHYFHKVRVYDKVYGGDYFSETGKLTLVCLIKVRKLRFWPNSISSELQYPSTFTMLASMFSDDNINPTGPLDCQTDVILRVGSSKIHCHRLILGMASKVLERMFVSNMKESRSQEIELKEIDLETVKSLISFIYQDKIEDEKINTDLLAAADMYEVLRLKKICSMKLAQNINMENVSRIWHCAYLHNEEDLAHLSTIYMMKKWKKLSNQSEIRELCTSYPDLLYTVSTLIANVCNCISSDSE